MAIVTYNNPGQRVGLINDGASTPAPAAQPMAAAKPTAPAKKKSMRHLNLGKFLHKKKGKR